MKRINYLLTLAATMLLVISCGEDDVDAPNARFSFMAEGLMVTFTDESVGADSYSWDFGDGNSSTEASPVHTYAEGGDYDVTLIVTNEGGSNEATETVTVEAGLSAADLAGTWVMAPEAGALGVGPNAGDISWWSNSDGDVSLRACYFDDTYTFDADGTFTIEMGDETWLEAWQGVDADGCGAPASPHTSGSYSFEVSGETLKVVGEGAFIGLPKAVNAGELSSDNPPAIPGDVTYNIVELGDDRLTINIEAGSGVWWTYVLVRQ